MAKTITFTYEDREYTLEYTRKSVEMMERQGFLVADIETKPMTVLPAMFAGAFLTHHRFVKKEVIDEIFSKIKNKAEFIQKLAEMYNEPISSLMDEPDEKEEGNLEWGASW